MGKPGYRNDNTTGVARGDQAETIYMVIKGRHFNDGCCFDYGNAETNNMDTGPGSMEALFWGNRTDRSTGAGHGPWVMADLEKGLWSGSARHNPDNTPILADFATAMLKGRPCGGFDPDGHGSSEDCFALKAGDASTSTLKTMFSGGRPQEYSAGIKLQGAIVLGIGVSLERSERQPSSQVRSKLTEVLFARARRFAPPRAQGDNSDSGVGTFFEGAMTAGWSSDATDAAVQASVASVGYALIRQQ